MTEYYTERYRGRCRCGREVKREVDYPMGTNSPPDVWVRCKASRDITNVEKVRE